MSEEKMLGLQMQVRQNQYEMMDYIKELEGWEEEMKCKEEKLKQKPFIEEKKIPPVRNSQMKKKKKKENKPIEKQPEKSQKIHGYDYRAWDKFDVEKACAEVEREEMSSTESVTDEELEEERNKLHADQLKEQGNENFKNGKFAEAIDCYTRGLAIDNQNALIYANRAMALLKQEQYAAAELDCTEAIIRDPGYVKAFSRRASARFAMKKYDDAQDDFKQVLILEPHNKFAKAELERIEKTLNPASDAFDAGAISDVGVVKPIYKKPQDRSKMPLRRIPIEEIGIEEDKASSIFRKKVETESMVIDKPDLFNVASFSTNCNDQHGDGLKTRSVDDNCVNVAGPSSDADSGQGDGPEFLNPAKSFVKTTAYSSEACSMAVPTSSFQFQADWKKLKHNKEHFYHYFRKIDPQTYRQIFGEAVDAEILSDVLDVLKTFYLRDELNTLPVLEQLTRVKRFTMTVMFLSEKDKQVIRELLRNPSTRDAHDEPTILLLQKLYEL